ncbi:MAG: hypothetical protein OHK0046_21940 [Anaerolineae bacterium]
MTRRYSDEREYYFLCPYCWQEISMLLDTTVDGQSYIEDCEICCNPIEINYSVDDYGEISSFDAVQLT